MLIQQRPFWLVAAAMLALPAGVSASVNMADTRSVGMGGVGAASANYLSASFHNPALATQNKTYDRFGLVLPVAGARFFSDDELYDHIDSFQQIHRQLQADPDNISLQQQWRERLTQLDDGRMDADGNAGMVIAVPNRHLSMNFFVKAEVAAVVLTEVDERDLAVADPGQQPLYSSGLGVAGGSVDIGVTLAKEFIFLDRDLSLGISPKYQRLLAYSYQQTLDKFDDEEIDLTDNYTDKGAFNLDIGAAYALSRHTVVGVSGRNLLSHSLDANPAGSSRTVMTYQIEPVYVAAIAYNHPRFTLAADIDLNRSQPFAELDYRTQFARLGVELDAWRRAQLRLGYAHSLTDSADDMVTAGIGLKPFGKFGVDIAALYGKEDTYGVSAQLVFHF
ncbi:hypothetical protein ABT56_00135 [Photobacterium aquae]|uniref:Conjugal transfer protein TraF n=1 Tax=Photobacterium aquae TaxID=1195763 RepID=A0A0J1HDD5_9GAMM|nr:conjugal transfer protein TraF [Photobacterium aquae]KLV09655.1 hypothetical protein ABT56_00135 [Photobacterium aquae]